MANKIQKPCRVCGKMFTPCSNCENDKTIFHWRRVACSQECVKEYFSNIEKSRRNKTKSNSHCVETADVSSKNDAEIIKPKRSKNQNSFDNKESVGIK